MKERRVWKSSEIEGNTYSLLETEALIKQQELAEGKSKEDATMLLNHKKALDFITDDTECSVNCENDSGPDDSGVSLQSSNSSEVNLTLVQNCPPVADAGKNIIYNRGKAQEIEEYTSAFRAHTGYEYTLDGSRSSDSTPIGELNYLWISRGYFRM